MAVWEKNIYFCRRIRVKAMNEQEQILYMQTRLTRAAAERWQKTLAEAVDIFNRFGVLQYIEECYELFHVQGDEANIEDIECYLRARGAEVC